MSDDVRNGDYAARRQEWEAGVERELARRPERRSRFESPSGIPRLRLYGPEHGPATEDAYLERLGFPGEYPFTRGVQPTMYRGQLWTMRQYAGYASAEETNSRFRYLLSQGQTGLSVAFDLPTQIGYDPDHPMARGEVGKVGVSVCSRLDMENLFDQIPLDEVSTSMTINAPAAVLLAMYLVAAEQQGVGWDRLRGTVQNDILKEYAARGTYIFPPRPSIRLVTDILEFCSLSVPRWNAISISGYHMREAGATAVQEVAFTLANAIAYVEAAVARGLAVDQVAPRLSFFFNAHNDFFEEIAKFRAARRMWAKIMRERFGARDPRSLQLRFHAQTAGSTLTAQQLDNNVVRVTVQALAAVLGGAQSLHTNAHDEPLALPTEESARLALRTQQIIAYESGVADVVDPLAGSYYVEWLTDAVESRAWRYIERIEQVGGAVRAVEEGCVQREIRRSAYETQRAIEQGEHVVVGVNRFVTEESGQVPLLRVDPDVGRRRAEAVARLRSERSQTAWAEAVAALREAAQGDANLMPAIVRAVRAYATVGEICDVLREVFGEYRPGVF
ncbi:MAG: methylmalonyl-CoA mutase family protein [Alicyclobacillaceae bacterium]|nr:methylmalonyl-CoA mutase family protein [Alicyclobacillaceae bacterium]